MTKFGYRIITEQRDAFLRFWADELQPLLPS
jgi:hypothetical protein